MKFKSKFGHLAMEDFKDADAKNLTVANEGWKGAVLGGIVGAVAGLPTGAAIRPTATKAKKELEALTETLRTLAIDQGKKAVKEGKISDKDFEKEINISPKEIFKGALLGALFGPVYGAIKGSEIEDTLKKIEDKKKQINDLLKKAGAKPANEEYEDVPDEDESSPENTDAGAGEQEPPTDATADASADGSADNADATPDADQTDSDVDAGSDPTDPPAAEVETNPENAGADAAVSDADNTGEPPTEETGELVDPEAEVVEDELSGVDDIQDDVEETTEDVENLDIAAESLENLVAGLESAMETGGLGFAASTIARNNLNTVTRFLKVSNVLIPALEDMESPSAKIEAASSMKDSIVKFIQGIIKAIKDAAMRFADWIVQIYKRLTNANQALKARAEKLLERVNGSEMKTDKIENVKLVDSISSGGVAIADLAVFAAGMGKAVEYMNNPGTYSGYVDALGLCEEMVKNPEREEEIRGKISETLSKWAVGLESHAINVTGYARSSKSSDAATAKVIDNTKAFMIPMLRNEAVFVLLPETAEAVGTMNSNVNKFGEDGKVTGVNPLDKAEAIKLCTVIIEQANNAIKSAEENRGGVKELQANIAKHRDTTLALLANLTSGKTQSESEEKGRKVGLFIAKMITSSARLPVHAINRAAPRSYSAILDLVAASLGGSTAAGADAGKKPEGGDASKSLK